MLTEAIETDVAKPSKTSWSDVKARLKHWDRAQLTGLIQDLFKRSQENRDFLITRLLAEPGDAPALAPYRKRVEAAFYGKNGLPQGRLNLRDGRKAILDYQAASGELAGTLELMLVYVETGTQFTRELGDISESFYDSLCSVVHDIRKHLRSPDGRQLYARFRKRLEDLAKRADGIGWGYGDYVGDVVAELASPLHDAAEPPDGELPSTCR
jgi:hypothetical protein